MKVNLHFENVGIGDCLLLHLRDNGQEFIMLIDCGKYNSKIKELFEETYKITKLDKLVITHFDDDHIKGVIELLKDSPELKIEDIWFNCFRHLPQGNEIELTDFQKTKIEELYSELGSKYKPVETDITAEQSLSLSNILSKNTNWSSSWSDERISVDNQKEFDLGQWGKIHLLSPTDNEIKELENLYKLEFCKKLYGKADDFSSEQRNSIYELLLRTFEDTDTEFPEEEYPISSKQLLNKRAIEDYSKTVVKIDDNETNRSSIAFIWTLNNHKILFLGDSTPDIVLKQIQLHKETNGITDSPLLFDAIKVSHHGSKRNITNELLNEIDSEVYIFSGTSQKRPDEICISKIINRKLPQGIKERKLYFNHKNDIVKNFSDNITIQKQLAFSIIIDSKVEI